MDYWCSHDMDGSIVTEISELRGSELNTYAVMTLYPDASAGAAYILGQKLTIQEMLDWLQGRGEHGALVLTSSTHSEFNCEIVLGDCDNENGTVAYLGPAEAISTGATLREAIQRLVVAMGRQEAQ